MSDGALIRKGTQGAWAIFSACGTYRYELGRRWSKSSIGDFRPEKGGPFGTFNVMVFEEQK